MIQLICIEVYKLGCMLTVDFCKKGIWLSKLLLYILPMGSVHCELGMLVWMNWDPGGSSYL